MSARILKTILPSAYIVFKNINKNKNRFEDK